MQTYVNVWMDTDDCRILKRNGHLNMVTKDEHGKDINIGSYLVAMAQNRRCTPAQLAQAQRMLLEAREQIGPSVDPSFWEGLEYADLLAEERRRVIVDIDAAMDLLSDALAVATDPISDDELEDMEYVA